MSSTDDIVKSHPNRDGFSFAKNYLNGTGIEVKKRKSSVEALFDKLEFIKEIFFFLFLQHSNSNAHIVL